MEHIELEGKQEVEVLLCM